MRATLALSPKRNGGNSSGVPNVAVDAAERPEFAPPKAFVEILGIVNPNLPFFKEPGLNMPRHTKVFMRMGRR